MGQSCGRNLWEILNYFSENLMEYGNVEEFNGLVQSLRAIAVCPYISNGNQNTWLYLIIILIGWQPHRKITTAFYKSISVLQKRL